jgi:hypothetical protein
MFRLRVFRSTLRRYMRTQLAQLRNVASTLSRRRHADLALLDHPRPDFLIVHQQAVNVATSTCEDKHACNHVRNVVVQARTMIGGIFSSTACPR